jgi:hypothetical protein
MMKRIGMSVCALVCSAVVSSPCIAQGNPWNGSWKADASSMKYDGPTFTVATDPTGFTVTRDGKASPKVVCDGRPHPDHDNMLTCTKEGSGYRLTATKDGKLQDKVSIERSPDGRTMTRKVEIFPAGDSPYTISTTSRRVSGGGDAPTVWKETGFNESQDTGILAIKVDGDSIAFKETDNDKPIVCKLDGTPTKFDGRTMSVKLDGPHTLKVTYRGADGKVERENTFVLSANGKTVHETDVTPEPSPSSMSLMFHKS